MPELLELKAVSKSYLRGERRLRVLDGVSLALAPGEIAAVVGSRQEGRTTLLKIAAGLLRPDSGQVLLRGEDLARLSDADRSALFASEISWTSAVGHVGALDVLHYLTLPLLMSCGRSQREARGLALAALERVGAEGCAGQRWGELSRFEQALVLLARASVSQPALLVLDDLLDGLGMLKVQEGSDVLRSLVRELGCAALLSSCDVEAAIGAERVYWCEAGQVKPMAGGMADAAAVIQFPVPAATGRLSGRGA
jgi:predicted ABC-type transport system involved in lysophospholipase L1 biosynthesis ATPase subunit